MTEPPVTGGVHVLDADTCFALLRDHAVRVGRVAVVDEDGYPHVVPVNYGVDGDAVVFRTDLGRKLERITLGMPMAFEADDVDPAGPRGWSVLLQGRGRELVANEDLVRVAGLAVKPWAAGNRGRYIRLEPVRISGRRIAPAAG